MVETVKVTAKPFSRGEGGPRRGSEEECGRQPNDLKQPEDLHQGPITNLRKSLIAFANFQVTARIPLQSENRFRRADSLTARNCGVIAPGNHWISDSLRGAPPPGEAFWWKPATFLPLIRICRDTPPGVSGNAPRNMRTPGDGCPDCCNLSRSMIHCRKHQGRNIP